MGVSIRLLRIMARASSQAGERLVERVRVQRLRPAQDRRQGLDGRAHDGGRIGRRKVLDVEGRHSDPVRPGRAGIDPCTWNDLRRTVPLFAFFGAALVALVVLQAVRGIEADQR